MEKVKLTKKQAGAIQFWLNKYGPNHTDPKERLLTLRITENKRWANEEVFPISELSVEQVAKALYIGYEVVETKEEKLLQAYQNAIEAEENATIERNEFQEGWSKGYQRGIEKAVNTLDIKIEGINK